ncbi:pathogenicity island protein [Aerococcus christensenii]|jgi:phage protein|uniref:Pathogenicity island protein n=1 Tax=Aerococcus christensenii TaxID=87541 RepID=A0A2I1K7I5_9LACT|nr:pathogenicity island protein [Aerococcus christensenii]PKY91596.1 pathogenicity island protein [Aerococcus christensenii]DAT16022.1 MAG TPA: Protein hipA, HTH-type transcriptional regulator, persistence, DNA-binding, Repressor, Transcription [Caudoviricetes sp.]
MVENILKKKLRVKFLKPKTKLRQERLKKELTTAYVANLIGLERRQYEAKEKGIYPFHDYEMAIIAKEFHMKETELFF